MIHTQVPEGKIYVYIYIRVFYDHVLPILTKSLYESLYYEPCYVKMYPIKHLRIKYDYIYKMYIELTMHVV